MRVFPSVWGSIVAMINEVRAEAQIAHPEAMIGFMDWEAHANFNELPENDLMGPTAVTMQEVSPQMFEMTFAVAISTHKTDTNLFRLRDYISRVFERLRVGKQLTVRDSDTAANLGFLQITETNILPMSRAEARPWQYVQVSALLEPTLT